ncbi:MAG: hypothetical protein ABIR66_11215 [Saprospiraceae bacterium]
MDNTESELNQLTDTVFENITVLLEGVGEFHHFGVVMHNYCESQVIVIDDFRDEISDYIEEIKDYIENKLEENTITSGALTYLVLYNKTDAAMIKIISQNSTGWLDFILPYNVQNGKVILGDLINFQAGKIM